MNKNLLLMMFAGVFLLTGCHICKSYEVSKECYPLCIKDREENLLLTENNWENFKRFRPIPYHSVGIRLIDNSSMIVTKLSTQITEEIVIPYVQLDKEKMIVTYYQFVADVKATAEKQECTYDKAAELTWECWLRKPGGKQTCEKLKRALPFIENMRAGNQLTKAFLRVSGDVQRLLITLPRQIKELEAAAKTLEGKILISAAGTQLIYNLTRLNIACSYLVALKADISEQDRQVEEYLAKFAKL
ncbi:MAG: hypothetical protein J6S54_01545 [Lentisphaeria bacterium]|nr:hypothetical protein [Lentisphaeria bacterium]